MAVLAHKINIAEYNNFSPFPNFPLKRLAGRRLFARADFIDSNIEKV